jgi:EmrB/QacA subfamily drug resistance transporter
VAVAVLAVGLDGTVLAVALPTLATALHATATQLVWFSSAYLLAWAAAMLPLGALGDRIGRKKVMVGSLVGFGLASVWAATSSSAGMFIAARAVGGIAGAGVVVMAMSAITVLFDERERPRAVGIWAGVNFLALPAGPLLGGWLLTRFWWGWVFLLNVPVVLVALAVVLVLVPESRGTSRGRVDWLGVVTFSAGLVALVDAFVAAGDHAWASAPVLVPFLVGAVLLVAFGAVERRRTYLPGREPLVDVRLFAAPGFSWGTVMAFVASLAMVGIIFTLPQYSQAVLGTDAIGSGVRLLPLIGGLVVGSVLAEPVTRAVGPRLVLVAAFVVLAAGLALGATTVLGSGPALLITWTAVAGAGLGLALSTATAAALTKVPPEHAGVATALVQALQDAGGPFGAAMLGAAALGTYRQRLDAATGLTAADRSTARGGVFDGEAVASRLGSAPLLRTVRDAFVHGTDKALLVCAAIAVAGAAAAFAFFPRGRTLTSEGVATVSAGVPTVVGVEGAADA